MGARRGTSAMLTRRTALEYRPDIDGMRGIAVLAVIWFHTGLPGMAGGFVGVDIFFVISGYLIASIIHRDVADGRFSFAYFYERRFRRIAPALVTVTAVTVAVGYMLLLPYELESLSRTAVSALGMVSNIYFWRTDDYFFAAADKIVPLLHTWSIGVEEQFYLLFPAALLIAERFGKPRLAVAIIGLGSFLVCLLATPRAPAASFYLLPARGWELMIGATLALQIVSVPNRARQGAALAGAALVAAGIIMISERHAFPGWSTLLPTIGAALIIGSGPHSRVAVALSFPPLVYVGRISYSLYLWHWPVLEYLRHWQADTNLPPLVAIAGVIISLLLSIASYHAIEQPARRRSTPFRGVLIAGIAGAGVVVVASVIAIAGHGLPQRLPERVTIIAAAHDFDAPAARACTDMKPGNAPRRCHVGPAGPSSFVIWGDSHAAAISAAVASGLGESGTVLATGGCLPTLRWVDPKDQAWRICVTENLRKLRLVEGDRRIGTVVLSAYWAAPERDAGPVMWDLVQELVDRLNAAGKRVIVVAGIPAPGVDVPWASAVRARYGRPALKLSCAKARVPLHGVILVDVSAGFCREPPHELFWDSNHPSLHAGQTVIAPAVRRAVH